MYGLDRGDFMHDGTTFPNNEYNENNANNEYHSSPIL